MAVHTSNSNLLKMRRKGVSVLDKHGLAKKKISQKLLVYCKACRKQKDYPPDIMGKIITYYIGSKRIECKLCQELI